MRETALFICIYAKYIVLLHAILKIMRNKSFILLTFAVCTALSVFAEIPSHYYDGVESKKGSDNILNALNARITNHTVIGYDGLEPYYFRTDFRADTLWDMYSTCRFTMADANKAQKALCDGWNKEHVVCQSWLGSGPMVSDLFNVYPTDARVNNLRSNYPYGVVGTNKGFSKDPNRHALGKLGSSAISGAGSDVVYEPDDQYKGDFARTYFYMVARYRQNTLNSGNGSAMFTSNPTNLTAYSLSFLLKWHREDPVSEKEIARNDSVYAIQHNRNPFIDYPYLVEYIWGDLTTTAVDFTELISSQDPDFIPGVSDGHVESTDPLLICSAKALTFPTILEGEEAQLDLPIQGARLAHDVSVSISGADAAMFSVSPTSVSLADMQKNSKQTLIVTYKPTTNAVHKATLTISSEGANPLSVALSGACAVECDLMWIVNCEEYNEGNPDVHLAVGSAITNLPDAPRSCSETSKQFVGWSRQQIAGTTDEMPEDLFSDASEAPAVNGNMTFYAVFARLTEQGSDTPENITWTINNAAGWTAIGMSDKGSYHVFVSGASITSPEINLATLESVTLNARTFGGTQYNIIDIKANGKVIGSIDAKNNTLKDVIWTNDQDLTGKGQLVFSSSTSTDKYGPAVASITIKSAGMKYTYDQYLTSCNGECEDKPIDQAVENNSIKAAAQKVLINGQLFIKSGESMYNIFGQRVQ